MTGKLNIAQSSTVMKRKKSTNLQRNTIHMQCQHKQCLMDILS